MSILDRLFTKKSKEPAGTSTPIETPASQQTPPDDIIPDITKPVENPRYNELFARWNESKAEADLNALLEEIVVKAKFLAVFESSAEIKDKGDHTAVLENETIMSFPVISDAENRSYQPVFGDWIELGKWQGLKQPPKTLIVSFDDLHAMLVKREDVAGIVINPFGESFVISRQWMASLKIRKDVKPMVWLRSR